MGTMTILIVVQEDTLSNEKKATKTQKQETDVHVPDTRRLKRQTVPRHPVSTASDYLCKDNVPNYLQ